MLMQFVRGDSSTPTKEKKTSVLKSGISNQNKFKGLHMRETMKKREWK